MVRRFRLRRSRDAFLRHLGRSGLALETLEASQGIDAMIRFAEVAQPWRVAREDGDALLLQWGSSRTLADGPYVDITRQFITPGADGAIIQLSLTFTFEPRSVLDALESGNQWSFGHSPRDFRALVEQQPAYLGTADALIVDRHLTLDRV